MRMRDWPLFLKIILLFLATAGGMGALLYYYFLPHVHRSLVDEKSAASARMVELAASGLVPYLHKERSGELNADRARSEAADMLRGLHYGLDGYFYVLSVDGRVLVHPDADLVGQNMVGKKDVNGVLFWDEILAGAKKNGAGTVAYLWPKPGQKVPLPKITAYRLIPEWGWIIATGSWVDDVDGMILALGTRLRNDTVLGGAAIILLLMLFSYVLTRPVRIFLGQSEKILSGDLTVEVDTNRRDEMGRLIHAIGGVMHRLVGIIDRVVPVAVRIDDSIVVLRTSVERTVGGTEKQADRARQISAAAEEMSQTVAGVARTAANSATLSSQAMEAALAGRQSAGRASAGVSNVSTASRTLAERFEQMNRSANEIGEVVNMIRSIAEQTNLIALNASIEASRAGLSGSRFAVIAEEVRKLARNAGDATNDVSRAVQSVQLDVLAIREAMGAVTENVAATSGAIGEADNTLTGIVKTFQDVDHHISQIAAAIEELSITSRDVSRNIAESMSISGDIEQTARRVKTEFNHLVEVADELRGATVGIKTKATEKIILDLAKTDHRIFVEKIDACLRGENDLQADKLADHTQCRFGKWYFSDGLKKCGHVQVFKDIDGPHAAVHRLGRQAVAQFRDGLTDAARESYLKMEDQSQQILSLLDQLKEKYETECR